MDIKQFEIITGLLERIVELLESSVQTANDAAEREELASHRPGCKCGYH